MRFLYALMLWCLPGLAGPSLSAQQTTALQTRGMGLFASDAPIKLRIQANFKELLKNRNDDSTYHEAVMTYERPSGEEVVIEGAQLRLRGNFRRKNCGFPPLRLKFDPAKVQGTLFEGQDKLKMVTHCENRRTTFGDYLLQEYLIYKMYNLLTDYSFRVQLLEVTYVDVSAKYRPIEQYAFLIEDEDQMARRLGGEMVEEKVNFSSMDQDEAGMMAVFQFMIGNTDWSVLSQHNIKVFKHAGTDRYVAIPYDFDWAGLIAPPYAQPNPLLGTTNVRQRVFRGYCRSSAEFDADFHRLKAQRQAIFALVSSCDQLSSRARDRSLNYLQSFYEILEDSNRASKEIREKCR
ncbi:MAG: hypothetical protein D6730_18030 [Bacteroidetes bacterium]|nr:MAG: hypothetical protein D6730_18030 [Bacteroidota bacterium]